MTTITYKRIRGERYVGAVRTAPDKAKVVHAFDFDDVITQKPNGFDNTGLTKDDFFDAARDFPPNTAVLELIQLLSRSGDSIAIATARPTDRLQETIDWLNNHNVPFDTLMLSKGEEPSGVVKQEMLLRLQKDYKEVATLFDDSPFNCEGARLQGITAVHLLTNVEYWDAHPENTYKVLR